MIENDVGQFVAKIAVTFPVRLVIASKPLEFAFEGIKVFGVERTHAGTVKRLPPFGTNERRRLASTNIPVIVRFFRNYVAVSPGIRISGP
jgi:hypothetical protein